MFLQVTGINEDIIDVSDAELEIRQNAIHQALKGGAQISQGETGVVEGVSTKRSDDCRLWNVVWVDRNLVVPLQEIQLAEDANVMEVECHVSHVGQRVVAGFSDHIKMAVITAGPPGAIVFLD